MGHPRREQVAEILVEAADGERSRGSGYLVTPGWVLTAAHVVARAASIGVWLGAPSELAPVGAIAVDPGQVLRLPVADLALLPVPEQPGAEEALMGRVDRKALEPLEVYAAGFPWFKLRPTPGREGVELREVHVARGEIAAGSDAKTGTLEMSVRVRPAARAESAERSPWEGMSGAAVWALGHVIGVVGQHPLRPGQGVLTVRPLAEALSGTDGAREQWQQALPQLDAVSGLPVVTPPSTRQALPDPAVASFAKALVPEVLVDREDELADLAAFCSGPSPWRWVQAEAFAGKTALLSAFYLRPPRGVDVVACFLQRSSGVASASYAADVLSRQLATHAHKPYRPADYTRERVDGFSGLLDSAAEASRQRGRRLLLVVDGLDEDETTESALAVGEWLPNALPDNAALIVASRAGVDVPVPPTHPLRRHVVALRPSEVAAELRALAEKELERTRQAGGLVDQALGFLAATSGGLTRQELTALLRRTEGRGVTSARVQDLLSGPLGRIVRARPDVDQPEVLVQTFSHDVLWQRARAVYAEDLDEHHEWLDQWADEYAEQDWPDSTPRYLLAPYGRHLVQRDEVRRLAELAASASRHDRMLLSSGADAAAIAEVQSGRRALADQPAPDFPGLVALAMEYERLGSRSAAIPPALCGVWVLLGQPHRGLALAQSLVSPQSQVEALIEVSQAFVRVGRPERAGQAVRDIPEPQQRTWALVELARSLSAAGELDVAVETAAVGEDTARSITRSGVQAAQALVALAETFADAGRPDRAVQAAEAAERLAVELTMPEWRDPVLRAVVRVHIAAGRLDLAAPIACSFMDPDREDGENMHAVALVDVLNALVRAGQHEAAERTARSVTGAARRTEIWSALARAFAAAGQVDRAVQSADEAERAAWGATGEAPDSWTTRSVVQALAAAGEFQRAADVAAGVAEPYARSAALDALARALAAAGRSDEAVRTAAASEHAAGRLSDEARHRLLPGLAQTFTAAGRPDEAERIACLVQDQSGEAEALVELAVAATADGRHDDAERLAGLIRDLSTRARALAALAIALAHSRKPDRAVRTACRIQDPYQRASVLCALAAELAASGQSAQAEKSAAAAERTVLRIARAQDRATALALVATAYAATGQGIRAADAATAAERTARSSAASHAQATALAELAQALAAAGLHDRAEQTAAAAEQAVAAAERTGLSWNHSRLVERAVRTTIRAIGDEEGLDRARTDPAAADRPREALMRVALRRDDAVTGPPRDAGATDRLLALALTGEMWHMGLRYLPADALEEVTAAVLPPSTA